jgi:hypothetical protein
MVEERLLSEEPRLSEVLARPNGAGLAAGYSAALLVCLMNRRMRKRSAGGVGGGGGPAFYPIARLLLRLRCSCIGVSWPSHLSRAKAARRRWGTRLCCLRGFTGCGKTPNFWLVRSSEQIFSPFRLVWPRFPLLFFVWRPIFRPPDTLRL